MTDSRHRRPHRAGAAVVAALVTLALASCAPATPSASREADSTASSGSVPQPGRTIVPELEPEGGSLAGYRIAVVLGGDPGSEVMRRAAQRFADDRGAELVEFAATTPDDDGVAGAVTAALVADADLVAGAGEEVVDVFSFETAQWLEQDFLVIGAQLPEPTANVTAVIWDGATSRGSAAASDGALDPSALTLPRVGEALAAGVESVRSGLTGVVLALPAS